MKYPHPNEVNSKNAVLGVGFEVARNLSVTLELSQ